MGELGNRDRVSISVHLGNFLAAAPPSRALKRRVCRFRSYGGTCRTRDAPLARLLRSSIQDIHPLYRLTRPSSTTVRLGAANFGFSRIAATPSFPSLLARISSQHMSAVLPRTKPTTKPTAAARTSQPANDPSAACSVSQYYL